MTDPKYSSGDLCTQLINNFLNYKSDSNKSELIDFFNGTDVYKFNDKIALVFSEYLDDDFLPVMINKIDKIRSSNHISTLVYACSEYDCSKYLLFFVHLFIEINTSVRSFIIGIIEDIKFVLTKEDKRKSLAVIDEFVLTLDNNPKKLVEVKYIKELIEILPVSNDES